MHGRPSRGSLLPLPPHANEQSTHASALRLRLSYGVDLAGVFGGSAVVGASVCCIGFLMLVRKDSNCEKTAAEMEWI